MPGMVPASPLKKDFVLVIVKGSLAAARNYSGFTEVGAMQQKRKHASSSAWRFGHQCTRRCVVLFKFYNIEMWVIIRCSCHARIECFGSITNSEKSMIEPERNVLWRIIVAAQ
jgi:hypothetical protein